MTWVAAGLIAFFIIGSIITAIYQGFSDFFKNITKYFDDRDNKLATENAARETASFRKQDNELNRQLFVNNLEVKKFDLEERIAVLQSQLNKPTIPQAASKETSKVISEFNTFKAVLETTFIEAEKSIRLNRILKLRTLWGTLRPDLTPRVESEKFIQWEMDLLNIGQSHSPATLLSHIPTFQIPVVSVIISAEPPRHTPPPKPIMAQIKNEYENWDRNFKIYDKERFALSEAELEKHFGNRILEWEILRLTTEIKNREIEARNQQLHLDFDNATALQQKKTSEYIAKRAILENAIRAENDLINDGDPAALSDLLKLIIYSFPYPAKFPLDFELEYSESNKAVTINYRLPSPEHLPQIKEKKFLKTKNIYKEIPYKEVELHKIYDAMLYRISLTITYIIANSVSSQFLSLITFNGWVKFIDPATGNEETACILSLQSPPKDILGINLKLVNPAECFKRLKGVGSSKLYGLVPIKPIIELNRKDGRFVQSHSIESALSNVENIASMPWEEFEHLIRGLFEKEFSKEGAEVRVTRASRDGGVDAVVFDPDPLRGGKIIIQSKRYINTVGVEAVRDLFGTVHSENAIKGILVTTADYSPEAYTFAKDKPITLINGNNLLHLLINHGYNVKIDLAEAREFLLKEKENH